MVDSDKTNEEKVDNSLVQEIQKEELQRRNREKIEDRVNSFVRDHANAKDGLVIQSGRS